MIGRLLKRLGASADASRPEFMQPLEVEAGDILENLCLFNEKFVRVSGLWVLRLETSVLTSKRGLQRPPRDARRNKSIWVSWEGPVAPHTVATLEVTLDGMMQCMGGYGHMGMYDGHLEVRAGVIHGGELQHAAGDPEKDQPPLTPLNHAGIEAQRLYALSESEIDESLTKILDALGNRHREIRWAAACAAGRASEPGNGVVERLFAGLEDPAREVAWSCAHSLGRIGARSGVVVERLIRGLESEKENVRVLCACGLGWCSANASRALLMLLSHDVPDKPGPWPYFEHGGSPFRFAHTRILENGDDHVPALIEGARSTDPVLRLNAIHALEQMGPGAARSASILTAIILGHSDTDTKLAALKAVSQTGLGPGMNDECVEYLAKAPDEIRPGLVEVLEKLLNPGDLPAVIELLDSSHPAAIMSAARIIASFGPEASIAIPVLEKLIERNDLAMNEDEVTASVIEAVGKIGKAAGSLSPIVWARLDAADSQIRKAAVESLSLIDANPEKLVAELKKRAGKDPDKAVNTAIEWALWRIERG